MYTHPPSNSANVWTINTWDRTKSLRGNGRIGWIVGGLGVCRAGASDLWSTHGNKTMVIVCHVLQRIGHVYVMNWPNGSKKHDETCTKNWSKDVKTSCSGHNTYQTLCVRCALERGLDPPEACGSVFRGKCKDSWVCSGMVKVSCS